MTARGRRPAHPLAASRSAVRWGVQHGVPRLLLARAARAGDPQARLIVDPAVRADPHALHDLLVSLDADAAPF